jgi:nucleoside-diphosphate-sugar epimerase
MNATQKIIVLGAGSLVAPWLLKRFTQKGMSGHFYSRKKISFDQADNFTWRMLDITRPTNFSPDAILISLLPLWLLPPLLPQLKNCRHLIAFSTTSIYGKNDSPNPAEQKLIKKIKEAEKKIIRISEKQKIPWTILRPTLIYDGHSDQNITAIAKFILKWRVLPVAKPARGLRQPVHANDLAAAVVSAAENRSSYNRSFNLGGGEILSYCQMVQRIFQAMGKPPRIIPLPLKLILTTCNLANLITPKGPNAAIFIRMNQDLIYDFTDAVKALNYTPRPFLPDFQKIRKKSISLK